MQLFSLMCSMTGGSCEQRAEGGQHKQQGDPCAASSPGQQLLAQVGLPQGLQLGLKNAMPLMSHPNPAARSARVKTEGLLPGQVSPTDALARARQASATAICSKTSSKISNKAVTLRKGQGLLGPACSTACAHKELGIARSNHAGPSVSSRE